MVRKFHTHFLARAGRSNTRKSSTIHHPFHCLLHHQTLSDTSDLTCCLPLNMPGSVPPIRAGSKGRQSRVERRNAIQAVPPVSFPEAASKEAQKSPIPNVAALGGKPSVIMIGQTPDTPTSGRDHTWEQEDLAAATLNNNKVAAHSSTPFFENDPSSVTSESYANTDGMFSNAVTYNNNVTCIRKATKDKLWHGKKFIQSNEEMVFKQETSSVCGFLLRACNVMRYSEATQKSWWKIFSKEVKPALTDHRNNIIKAMQKQFNSKLHCVAAILLLYFPKRI